MRYVADWNDPFVEHETARELNDENSERWAGTVPPLETRGTESGKPVPQDSPLGSTPNPVLTNTP